MAMRNIPVFVLAILLAAAISRAGFSAPRDTRVVFAAKNGAAIVLDVRKGILRRPHARSTGVRDCSDNFQTCMTDDRGFAFAYFRDCNGMDDYRRLRFDPKIVAVLNDDIWMVFDAAPNYMFHYLIPKGIVGIYIGPTRSFDFRSLLNQRDIQLSQFDAMEYRITGPETVAACTG